MNDLSLRAAMAGCGYSVIGFLANHWRCGLMDRVSIALVFWLSAGLIVAGLVEGLRT